MQSSYQNLKTEPAFVTNEQYIRSQRQSGPQKAMNDCCYSFSNLALIVACVVGLIFLVKFLQDDLLYEYGEHLLTLRFYRELIYIIVVIPLTLLIPLFNAASAFFFYGRSKQEIGTSLLRVKIFYQTLVGILVFIALVFITPSIRFTNMVTQIEFELRKHMKMRYANPFSYELLDRLQVEYQCCDTLWYTANYMDKIPMSCYVPDGTFSNLFPAPCSDVLASYVSNWCSIIAACLVIILVALCVLLGIDILELISLASGQYDIGQREANLAASGGNTSLNSITNGQHNRQFRGAGGRGRDSTGSLDSSDESAMSRELATRLRMAEREREQRFKVAGGGHNSDSPLLANLSTSSRTRPENVGQVEECHLDSSTSEDLEPNSGRRSNNSISSTPVLTRAHYTTSNNMRPKSPVFLSNDQQQHRSQPAKSVLKKTSSFQRIDTDDDLDEDGLDLHEHQRQLQRELQTRRSLLSVRFAE